ncbi:MAG: FAD-dependent tricarballylate dehydrogenase TcuA [Acidimicrobiia bacterium]
MSEKVDLVVVGGASAGYAAAVAASHAGVERIIVLEKAPRDEVGGNCRFSLMGFRFAHGGAADILTLLPDDLRQANLQTRIRPYAREDFRGDLQQVTQGRIDPELADILVDDSREAIGWMTELGHKWQFFHGRVEIDGEVHYNPGVVLCPAGGGLGLVEHWISIGNDLGIELRTDSRVSAILGDHRGVAGVQVDGPEGRYEIEAESVILASGGFQASPERRGRYLPPNADLMKVRGSRHNTGEVLDMAIGLGAATSGQWQGAHASPVAIDAPDMEMDNQVNRYAYPYGITVDRNGRRFFDEGERHRTYTYAKTGWAVLGQEGGVAYQIYDQASREYFPSQYATATPVEAPTIRELAGKIGIDPDRLEATVQEFNASVDDETVFDPTREDGRGTKGLTPKKTNWARALSEGPFLAYGVTGGITFSFGGVRVNRNSQVLNTGGVPMKGLFANGDIVGMFYHNYPSSSGMTRNVVFGGRAGAAAAGIT